MSCASGSGPANHRAARPDAVDVEAEPPQPVEGLAFTGCGVLGAQHEAALPFLAGSAPHAQATWVDQLLPRCPGLGSAVGDRPTIYDVAREARRRRVDGLAGLRPTRPGQRRDRARDLRGGRADRLPHAAGIAGSSASRPRGRRADGLRHHQPVLRRDHQGRRGGGPQAGLRAAALATPRRPARSSARHRARARPGRGRRAGQLPDERLRDPHDRQAEAAGAAQPADPRGLLHRHDNPRGMRRAAEHLGGLGHARSPTWAGRRPAGPTACAGGRCGRRRTSWTLRVRRIGPTRRPRPCARGRRGRAADRRRGRDGRARLQRRAGDRRHQGPAQLGARRARGRQRRRFRQHPARRGRRAGADHGRRAAAPGGRPRASARPARAGRTAPRRPASRWCCRSRSWCASRPLSAAGTAPRRRRGTTSVSGSASNAATSTVAGSR